MNNENFEDVLRLFAFMVKSEWWWCFLRATQVVQRHCEFGQTGFSKHSCYSLSTDSDRGCIACSFLIRTQSLTVYLTRTARSHHLVQLDWHATVQQLTARVDNLTSETPSKRNITSYALMQQTIRTYQTILKLFCGWTTFVAWYNDKLLLHLPLCS